MDKKKSYIIAGALTVALFAVGLLGVKFLTRAPQVTQKPIEIDTSSEIIGATPQETASRFVYASGNMGNIEHEVDGTTLINNSALKGNRDRRIRSINKVMPAIIPGSPLHERGQAEYAARYTKGLDVPTFYNVDVNSIKVSNEENKRKLQVTSENGLHEYSAVDVYVTFESKKTTFVRPRDTTWDGNYTEIANIKKVDSLLVTLVELDGKWFIYDMPTAENDLNSRLSTWLGTSSDVVNEEHNIVIGKIMVDGFEPTPTE